ncbi:hypothetical protein [Streptomyces lavendulae]|uniref:hypothetical protein n=1 Tax=Streptomyces lavendulae TaxID=1914 RepID=UPI0024A4F233|nr:hypothetical protein [Streptomyces lavendulae]GLW04171.1 hypothetical protein Slala05_78010 [Streptomyces lavendulae subsp. lavendulae]
MSQPAHSPTPLPQPPVQAEAIRATLAQVAPHLLDLFDKQRARAKARAVAETSPTPMRVFAERWAVEVAVARHPEAADRLRALEAKVGEVTDPDEGMKVVSEISAIRRAAAIEAGIRPVSGSSQ